MSPADLRTRIEAGQTSPLVVLVGADEVEKSEMAADFAGMVEEGLEAFNVDRFHGAETGIDRIIDAASTLPMMAPRRIVLVLEAEKLLVPRRESKAADEEQARLEAFLEHPPPHATVVFVCGPLDMRRRAIKILMRQADVVDCGTIADEADAERWVRARAARDRVALEPAAVRALVERAGTDLVRLRGALERVALYALGQKVVTADDVREAVPAAPEAQAEFGVAKAIWRNDARDALRELALALDAGASPWFLLGQLRTAAERLPPARVKEGIEAAFRADLALKSSGGDQRLLLERLVVELAAPGRRGTPVRPPRR
jgi:DNA polymerase-3 subunit delta